MEIMVTPPPTVEVTSNCHHPLSRRTLPVQHRQLGCRPPLTAEDLSFSLHLWQWRLLHDHRHGRRPHPIRGHSLPTRVCLRCCRRLQCRCVRSFLPLRSACLGMDAVPLSPCSPPQRRLSVCLRTPAPLHWMCNPSMPLKTPSDTTWSLDGAGVIGTGPAPPSSAPWKGPGSFTFELEVSSSNGCTDDPKAAPSFWLHCHRQTSPRRPLVWAAL